MQKTVNAQKFLFTHIDIDVGLHDGAGVCTASTMQEGPGFSRTLQSIYMQVSLIGDSKNDLNLM